MALQDTNLIVQMSRLPQTFVGTPQALIEEAIERMKIVSPTGTNFIYVGDTEPTSNVGPWLRDGTKWYVYDEELKRYVPLDISESETRWFWIGAIAPASSTPPVWLRTSQDASEADPTYGQPLGWYMYNGSAWVPYIGIVLSGPTSSRPASPADYQQYYDTTIACLIWWERSAWRTVAGCPGDVKAVVHTTLEDALARNPGWTLLGGDNQAWRGRLIGQATKDTAGTQLTVNAGVAERFATETIGETDLVAMETHTHPADGGGAIGASAGVPYPPSIYLWHLVKE
jgi:hypothetical protein